MLVDQITGLGNFEAYKQRFAELLQNDSNFFIIKFNIDSFMYFNDTFGHKKGDEILREIATMLMDNFDKQNSFRISGSDLICIQENTNKHQVKKVIRKINQEIVGRYFDYKMFYEHRNQGTPFTLSMSGVGLEISSKLEKDIDYWLEKIDSKFYRLKRLKYRFQLKQL